MCIFTRNAPTDLCSVIYSLVHMLIFGWTFAASSLSLSPVRGQDTPSLQKRAALCMSDWVWQQGLWEHRGSRAGILRIQGSAHRGLQGTQKSGGEGGRILQGGSMDRSHPHDSGTSSLLNVFSLHGESFSIQCRQHPEGPEDAAGSVPPQRGVLGPLPGGGPERESDRGWEGAEPSRQTVEAWGAGLPADRGAPSRGLGEVGWAPVAGGPHLRDLKPWLLAHPQLQ